VLARLNRRPRLDTLPPDIAVTLFCPLCRKKQAIPAGGSACKGCGLRIEVRTEEPTCSQCGYLLYRLTSDNCPECGTPVQRPAAA
jgi:Zn finger protein HypA/HybF involved in hydrogenase expression